MPRAAEQHTVTFLHTPRRQRWRLGLAHGPQRRAGLGSNVQIPVDTATERLPISFRLAP